MGKIPKTFYCFFTNLRYCFILYPASRHCNQHFQSNGLRNLQNELCFFIYFLFSRLIPLIKIQKGIVSPGL